MPYYDPSGWYHTDDGKKYWPEYTDNAGIGWYITTDRGFQRVPAQPQNLNTDPRGPGGEWTTEDPNAPGQAWYRDASYTPGQDISQTPGGGGALERIDAQGNVIGTYYHPTAAKEDVGGRGWDLTKIDPSTGGPTSVSYPVDQGGVFGLGPVWGSLAAVAMIAAMATGQEYLPGLLAPAAVEAGTGALGAGELGLETTFPAAAGSFGAGALGAGELGLETTFPAVAAGTAGGAADVALAGGIPISTLAPDVTAATLGTTTPATGGGFLGSVLGALGGAGGGAGGGGLGSYFPLISTGINTIGGLIGAGMSASAARDAANIQAQAANQANQTLWQMYQQQRADQGPYREAGYYGLGSLIPLTMNPFTYPNYQRTPTLDPSAYGFTPNAPWLSSGVGGPGGTGGGGGTGGDGGAGGMTAAQAAQFQPLQPGQYAFTPTTGQQVLEDDPGYAFRVQQGQKALERSAAAQGTLVSGGQLKAAQDFGQQMASQEYGAAYQRALGRNEMNYQRAYQANADLYQRALGETQRQYELARTANETDEQRRLSQYSTNLATQSGLRNMQYNELANLAGLGQTSVGQLGEQGTRLGGAIGGNITSAGAAEAAGRVGAANAWAGGLQGIGKAANQYLNYNLLSQYVQGMGRNPYSSL